jgi:hypothetical protein
MRSGRPPIDFPDIRILVSLDEQPFHSAYSIAEVPGVSHSILLSHLRESLDMKFSFPQDPVRVNDQFATDSDRNSQRVIAGSQGSREKSISKICDWGRESVHFGISSLYEMGHIAR